jgi:hypothetical protein
LPAEANVGVGFVSALSRGLSAIVNVQAEEEIYRRHIYLSLGACDVMWPFNSAAGAQRISFRASKITLAFKIHSWRKIYSPSCRKSRISEV